MCQDQHSSVLNRQAARHWPIRTGSLLLLLLIAGAWGWSYAYCERLTYENSQRNWCAEITQGEIALSSFGPSGSPGWSHWHGHPDWEIGELYTGLPHVHFLGFRFFAGAHPYSTGVTVVFVILPCWFLTGAAVAASWLAWWMTGCRQQGRGFAVVMRSIGPAEKR